MLLRGRDAAHEPGHELVQAAAAEDLAHPPGDRQVDADAAREGREQRRGRQPLDRPDLGLRLPGLRPARSTRPLGGCGRGETST